MKSFLGFILILNFFSFSEAVIYGNDDIKELYQVPHLNQIAQAIAVTVDKKSFLKQNPDGSYENTDWETMVGSSTVNACHGTRFGNQRVTQNFNCTGFLIGSKYLLTAGHCLIPTGVINDDNNPDFCKSFAWYFGYNLKSPSQISSSHLPKNAIYHCTKVIRAENKDFTNNTQSSHGNDFAILELDRPVVGVKPLKLNFSYVEPRSQVYTLGHPFGLPLKHSGASSVLTNSNPLYFETNLDSFGGNSGGPVFNRQNEVVGILISGHPSDLHVTSKGCSQLNRCDNSGKNCLNKPPYNFTPTSNHIQKLMPLKKYLP